MMKAVIILLFSANLWAQTAPGEPNTALIEEKKEEQKTEEEKAKTLTGLEKRAETVDFKSIQEVLKNDRLDQQVQKIDQTVKKVAQQRSAAELRRYQIPPESEFWGFFSEYWLVKSATVLKWDFSKPDYGLDSSFTEFLERMGMLEKKFKILLIDTPAVPHFGLPTYPNEFLFILSVPFIRTLDLSKLEISLLLFEDVVRMQAGYFQKAVTTPELKKLLGSNFHTAKKLDMAPFTDTLKKYDEMIFDKGMNFQQQYEVTKQMDQLLRSDLKLWNAYVGLLKKIDELVKSNLLYRKYVEIYPSPELQLGWLIPKKER